MDLTGKVVLVTGASSGIGAALAREFSKSGARVALAARRKPELEETAANCSGPALAVPTDICRQDQRAALLQRVLADWGRIDILVNNAGMGAYGLFLETDEALWRRIFEVNVFAQVFLTQAVLPHMLAQDFGLIVNMGSIGSLLAHADKVVPYVSGKHAMLGFSRGLAQELAGSKVRVQTACPHLTDTGFFASSPGASEMEPVLESYQRFMDSPAEVARGIIEQLGTEQPIIFPTKKTENIFQSQRDL